MTVQETNRAREEGSVLPAVIRPTHGTMQIPGRIEGEPLLVLKFESIFVFLGVENLKNLFFFCSKVCSEESETGVVGELFILLLSVLLILLLLLLLLLFVY